MDDQFLHLASSHTGYFLITHGSRSPHSLEHLHGIQAALQRLLPTHPIGGGCLEGLELPLWQQMAKFSAKFPYGQLFAVPLFLLQGLHTQQDIPATLKQLPDDRWQVLPMLGEHPGISRLLANHFLHHAAPQDGEKILLCHGSTWPGATTAIETMGQTIGAKCIYWRGNPAWQDYLSPRKQPCVVLPYFLAGSGIMELIASQGANAPHLRLLPSPFTPQVIADLIHSNLP